MKFFIDSSIVQIGGVELLPGSGVDLRKYAPSDKTTVGKFRFLFVGRLLTEKGIGEYLEAAVTIAKTHNGVIFDIVGELESEKSYFDKTLLGHYLAYDFIHYHGAVSPDCMPEIIATADCVVLPSYYREGVPRSLLEAAAMAKPIITTENVGCREVVDHEVNGLKCGIKDVPGLIAAMTRMLSHSEAERVEMGRSGRRKVEASFDERLVLNAYRRAVSEIVDVVAYEVAR